MALIVAVFGSQTDSRLLLFYSVFVCLYIGCSIIKNVCSDTSKSSVLLGFLPIHQAAWQQLQCQADRMISNLSRLSRSAYDVCRWEQACKHLYGCAIPVLSSSSKALESWRFVKHNTRHTLYFLSCKLHYHRLCPAPWYFGDFRMTFKQH